MILVGVKSGDLPGALTMLADYYQRQSNIWTRLKGLIVYPLIMVMFVAAFDFARPGFAVNCVIGPSFWAHFCGGTSRMLADASQLALQVYRGLALWASHSASFSDWRCWRPWLRATFLRIRRKLRWRLPVLSRKPAWPRSHRSCG